MPYWSNIFGMAGAALIAVAFMKDGSLYSFFWGVTLSYIGYLMWRKK